MGGMMSDDTNLVKMLLEIKGRMKQGSLDAYVLELASERLRQLEAWHAKNKETEVTISGDRRIVLSGSDLDRSQQALPHKMEKRKSFWKTLFQLHPKG